MHFTVNIFSNLFCSAYSAQNITVVAGQKYEMEESRGSNGIEMIEAAGEFTIS
jgi:hypothetical protein